jgi:hypothetical protein
MDAAPVSKDAQTGAPHRDVPDRLYQRLACIPDARRMGRVAPVPVRVAPGAGASEWRSLRRSRCVTWDAPGWQDARESPGVTTEQTVLPPPDAGPGWPDATRLPTAMRWWRWFARLDALSEWRSCYLLLSMRLMRLMLTMLRALRSGEEQPFSRPHPGWKTLSRLPALPLPTCELLRERGWSSILPARSHLGIQMNSS